MIYFDNSATGGFKPRSVTDTAENIIRYLSANPGRSGHRLSVTGANIVYDTRKILGDFFNASPERVIFTKNCTEALNTAILGSVKPYGHIITTCLEHNSVLRPLYHLNRQGLISLTIVYPKNGDYINEIKKAINDKTYMIITTSISNVTGESLPIEEIATLAKERNLKYLVDGAQGGGHIPISCNDGISMLALAGHKGLYGIMGSGALILSDDIEVSPLTFGGTGTETFNEKQPENYPEKLESGTLNLPAVASLFEGVRYVKNNFKNFSEILSKRTERVIGALSEIDNITVYSKPNPAGIVSFKFNNIESIDAAEILNKDYDVAVRGGFHCAPLVHKNLKTDKEGLVRASFSAQNSDREIAFFINAIYEIARRN
ncbi:MAG: aminotransferase class V-fold PLP-dependent enzyme [Firmicutes bacterium]|nr:aminotransferase class V-fold PLP-dependent enzyme [Candidatus Caballimonas caccae]